MTSIMSLLSSLYLHYTSLSSLCCHPLRLPVSNHVPLYLHPSVYPSIIFFSVPLPFFPPFSSIILLLKLICCCLDHPSSWIYPSLSCSYSTKKRLHTSSSPVFSVPFCCHYRRHHFHSAVPACLSSHHLSVRFFLFGKRSGGIQPLEGHLLADLTGLNVAVTLAVAAGCSSKTRPPNRQPAFTLCLETVWLFICRHLAKMLEMHYYVV